MCLCISLGVLFSFRTTSRLLTKNDDNGRKQRASLVLAFFFVLNFIFLNRDFGCIKTRIYNLFGLSVLNSTFTCCSTITTNECIRQTSLLSRLAFTSIVYDICPPSCFARENKMVVFFHFERSKRSNFSFWWWISHRYRYFLGSFGGAKRHHVQFRWKYLVFFVRSDLIGNLLCLFLFCVSILYFSTVLTEWDSCWVCWGGENHSREMGYVTITITIVFCYFLFFFGFKLICSLRP